MDLSRSMVLVIPVLPLGWMFAAREARWRKFHLAPAIAVAALALPAHHVMSHRVVPVDDFLSRPHDLAVAESNLGVKFLRGEDVPKNSVVAVKWFLRAAEHGNSVGQSNLGVMYAHGDGVPKDSVAAIHWYRKAAEQDDAAAQFNLGGMYYLGEGVAKDLSEAVTWYRRSAEKGHAAALFNLGVLHFKGEGVVQNEVEALALMILAAEAGDGAASEAITTLEGQLGPDRARAARARARELSRVLKR